MTENEIIATLAKSKAAANRIAKKATIDHLERAIANLKAALDAEKKRDAAKSAKRREANIKKLTAIMADMGLSPNDIAKLADNKKPAAKKKTRGVKKGAKVAAKYEISVDGEKIQWTGRGRMPVVFREFIEGGGSLENCLIKG